MKVIRRFFFKLLYHQFAFAYDLVAATVSLGQWKNWVASILPFIEGTRILEIGHGPGHLQRILLSRRLSVIAIDESAPMGRLARHNTDNRARLTRGLAQHLPFADASFDTVVSTFPAEYITDPLTLAEVQRCLSDGGRFLVLPSAWPKNPYLDWLFKVTGESPSDVIEVVKSKFEKPFVDAGFETEIKILDVHSSLLLVLLAKK